VEGVLVSKISQYPTTTTPPSSMEMLGTDPTDDTESPEGSTKTTTIANIRAASLPLPTAGTYPGGTTEFLRADQTWSVPAGGGGGGSVPSMQVIFMDSLGADHTGTTTVTSIFNTALSGAGTNPCVIQFGVGTYLWSTAPNSLTKDQSVIGWGSRSTYFNWTGSGPLFTITEAAVEDVWDGSDNAGALAGFSVTGSYGTGTNSAIKYGALQGLRLDDIGMYGLPGGCIEGYQVTAHVDWAEEAVFTRLDISECGVTSGYVFAFNTTSFDYSSIDALVVVEPNIDVISLNGGAELEGLYLGIRGNLHAGTSNTGAVISMDRASSATASLIGGASFAVSMETDSTEAGGTGTVGHYMLYMNSDSAASQFQAEGTFFAYSVGAPSQGTYNPNNLPAAFTGFTNALDGTPPAQGAALTVLGGSRWTSGGDGFGSFYDNTVFWEFGDVQTATLANGAQTLTMDGTDGFIIRGLMYFKEPASGAAPTVTITDGTWIGAEPTWASSGRVWKVFADYLPVENVWYMQSGGVS
jgi:hypothetical protein